MIERSYGQSKQKALHSRRNVTAAHDRQRRKTILRYDRHLRYRTTEKSLPLRQLNVYDKRPDENVGQIFRIEIECGV